MGREIFVQRLFSRGKFWLKFRWGDFATLENPKALTASRTPQRASPCSVQKQKVLQIKLPLKSALVHNI